LFSPSLFSPHFSPLAEVFSGPCPQGTRSVYGNSFPPPLLSPVVSIESPSSTILFIGVFSPDITRPLFEWVFLSFSPGLRSQRVFPLSIIFFLFHVRLPYINLFDGFRGNSMFDPTARRSPPFWAPPFPVPFQAWPSRCKRLCSPPLPPDCPQELFSLRFLPFTLMKPAFFDFHITDYLFVVDWVFSLGM